MQRVKGGVGILLASKYASLVTAHGALYENKVVWVKIEGVEGGNIGIVCIYAPNIPTDRRHLWHIMVDALPKDCDWIIGGDFNMTERAQDKSRDCGRAISDVERLTWEGLLNAFKIQDNFVHQGGPRYSWNNSQKGHARRLARLDRFYIPSQSRLKIHHTSYFIHGHSVGSDHSPVQIEIGIGDGELRKSTYKWNVDHLKDEACELLKECWKKLPEANSFFSKLRHISKVFRQFSKRKAREYKKKELDTRAKLEVAVATLHEDVYNIDKQGVVSQLQ